MKTLLFYLLLPIGLFAQYCPALGPDQILPCGQTTTTLTADFSQCAPGTNPNATTAYTVASIPFAAPTNTGTQLFMSDDSQQGPFNIGFTFCFFGQTYTQFWVGSNGWISFSAAQPTTFTSAPIPGAGGGIPVNCIMGPWQDWHPGVGGQIRYQVQGVAPCRRLVVSWIGMPMFSCTSTTGTFHIVIHESTNVIENHIQSKQFCAWAQGTAVQGIQNATGTVAVTVPGRNSTQWTATNDAWRWTPAGPAVLPIPTWFQVGNPVAIGQGTTITVTPPAAGALYTCRLIYPTCNAGWASCNATAGPGPDTVFVQPGPPIPVLSPIIYSDTICWNSPIETYSVTDLGVGFTYTWQSPGNIILGQGTSTIQIDWSGGVAGNVLGAASVIATSAAGCQSLPVTIDAFILNVTPQIDTILPQCSNNDCIILNATPLNGIFSGTGLNGFEFCPTLADTNLNVIVYTYTQNGCTFTDTTEIIVNEQPQIISITPDQFIQLCDEQPEIGVYNVVTTLPGETEWNLNGLLYNDNTLTVTWESEGYYTLTAIHTTNGCVSDPATTTVSISRCPEMIFYIPNTFTPDGDEYNQTWQPVFTSGFDPYDFHIIVFNRWGEIIWESRDATATWDGSYKGRMVTAGIYTWLLQYGDSVTDARYQHHGHLTLIR